MRNIFDQYSQPENKVTHALITALTEDRKLLKPFLKMLDVKQPSGYEHLHIDQQCVPGSDLQSSLTDGELEKRGLPDGCIYDDEEWAVLIEVKVQAEISVDQLRRHRKTAEKYGYTNTNVVLITIDKPKRLPKWVKHIEWREVYTWFCNYRTTSYWANQLVQYIEVFETKMPEKDYEIRGTMTQFNGFHFSEKHPYTYQQGKRLVKLLHQELRQHKKLVSALDLDVNSTGRKGITRNPDGGVWDTITTVKASKFDSHTSHPHATVDLEPTQISPALTIPNSIRGGVRKKLAGIGIEGFADIIKEINRNMEPLYERVPSITPKIYIIQRYYKQMGAPARHDALLEVNIRTIASDVSSGVWKHQPMWCDAIYSILLNKKTNIQLGLRTFVAYDDRVMQSGPDAVNTVAEILIACKPIFDLFYETKIDASSERKKLAAVKV
ncbi:PD-(D/E)XK nuclease family protein [Planctomycetota bacterium]|nr:PD-(D/E)XK nuclease family protein [Planctomycetota bacterium]